MIRMLFKFTDKSLNDVLPLIEADMSNNVTDAEAPKKELPKQSSSNSTQPLEANSPVISTNNENKKIKVQPVQQPVQQPIQQPVPQPIQQPVPQPVPQPVQQPVLQPVQQPVPQPVQQPVPQSVQQPVQQPVPQSVQQPVQQPVQPVQPVPQPVQQPIQQQINDNLDDKKLTSEKINRDLKFYNPPKDNSSQYNRSMIIFINFFF